MVLGKKGDDSNFLGATMQSFDWGTVKWLHEPENQEEGRLAVGHVTFFPRKRQEEHTHTGDEQIIYTVSGRGEHWIDGRHYPLIPGSVYHIRSFARHEIRNSGAEDLNLVIVYNTGTGGRFSLSREIEESLKDIASSVDLKILQEVMNKYSTALELTIVLKDDSGKRLTAPAGLTTFCTYMIGLKVSCPLASDSGAEHLEDMRVTRCCFDLVRIHVPIVHAGKYFGSIVCGPMVLNEPSPGLFKEIKGDAVRAGIDIEKAYQVIRKITKAQMYAIMDSLKTVGNSIMEMGIRHLESEQLRSKTLEALRQTQARVELEKALSLTKMKLVEAQMSPHFLFNTLGVIAELAYMNKPRESADTAFALSNLLRMSLKKAREMVPLREELRYVGDYLFIQKKRFRDFLAEEMDIASDTLEVSIPFLTVQTLVENILKHAFADFKGKGIVRVKSRRSDGSLILSVEDNGTGIKAETVASILSPRPESRGLGYRNLITRLDYYYGKDYRLQIDSSAERGSMVVLTLPCRAARMPSDA